MPETTVNPNGLLPCWEDEIGAAWETLSVQPIAIS